ncbi:hypothetical protein [Kitasatospora acidiphila]|uniref:hypothetical protein n=1 Tax=Kitasatospora acidiphila TaxID=2567942 RepID=UPI003C77A5AA
MRYVDLDATIGKLTGVLDPHPYLAMLPELGADLPAGAAAFATDPEHYNFTGQRCVKDLTLDGFLSDAGEADALELRFRHNCWKHEEDLVIRYQGVTDIRLEGAIREELGPLILDEILPHQQGCTHELAFRPGRLTITAADLATVWIEANCPEARKG